MINPVVSCVSSKFLLTKDASSVTQPFMDSKIKVMVSSCGNDRALVSNRFSFQFLMSFWGPFELDFIKKFQKFHVSYSISTKCNYSLISLTPKMIGPLSLGDYRPINLIGCIYKKIAKVLLNVSFEIGDGLGGGCLMKFQSGS